MQRVLAVPGRRIAVDALDTLLEDAHPLERVHVVEDDTFLTADDDDLADLVRIRPADVNVPDDAARISECDEPDVFETAPNRVCANGADPGRRQVEQVVEDRNIVWRKVPDGVHVGPDRAEARPLRVEVIDLAHFAGVQILLDRLDARVVEERVTHHEGPSASCGEIDQLACIFARRREGLLDKHMLARLERHSRQVPMGGSVGHDRHGVGIGRGGRLRSIVRDSDGKTAANSIESIRSAVADGDDAGIAELAEYADVVLPQLPSPNDGDSCGFRLDFDQPDPLAAYLDSYLDS